MADLSKLTADVRHALANGVDKVVLHLDGGILLTVQKDPFPRVKGDMPATMAVTGKEGGDWEQFEHWQVGRPPSPLGKLVHAIRFENGRIWDAQNGWRPHD